MKIEDLIKRSDTISRQEAINAVLRNLNKEEYRNSWESGAVKVMKDTLEKMPTADRPSGKWIEINIKDYKAKCSHCGTWSPIMGNFCPNCGARMKGE